MIARPNQHHTPGSDSVGPAQSVSATELLPQHASGRPAPHLPPVPILTPSHLNTSTRMVSNRWTVAAVLLQLSSTAFAHGHDESSGNDTDGMKMGAGHQSSPADGEDWYYEDSYSGLSAHSKMMVAHIVLMVLAWFFILPIGRLRLLTTRTCH